MKYLRLLTTVLLLLNVSIVACARTQADNALYRINHLLRQYMVQHAIPGLALGLYYQGKTSYFLYGVEDKSTQTPLTQQTKFVGPDVNKTPSTIIELTQSLQKQLSATVTHRGWFEQQQYGSSIYSKKYLIGKFQSSMVVVPAKKLGFILLVSNTSDVIKLDQPINDIIQQLTTNSD